MYVDFGMLLNVNTQILKYQYIYNIGVLKVITKLPNSEQFSKGKVKTHKNINRQSQSTTGKLGKP